MGVAIRALVYVVVGLWALTVLVPSLITELSPGPYFYVGLCIAGLGLGLYLWTVWHFATAGRGTPVPLDPPRALVVRGPYRVVRNPMAAGFVLILAGEAVAFASPGLLAYAAFSLVAIHLFIVFVEEPGLKVRFGDSYSAYLDSVHRWRPTLSGLRKPGPNPPRPGNE
jgi:protein-S-isoprenylcysteine O-methyltransferase Ste14